MDKLLSIGKEDDKGFGEEFVRIKASLGIVEGPNEMNLCKLGETTLLGSFRAKDLCLYTKGKLFCDFDPKIGKFWD